MSKPEAKAEQQKLEKVTLLKSHIHGGESFKEGAEIKVNEVDKAWLIQQKIIAAQAAK